MPDWLKTSGTPTNWFRVGTEVLGLWPKPDSSNGLLDVMAKIVPKKYDNSLDRVRIRDQFKWGAVYYAVGEFYASRGDLELATKWHNEYLKQVGIQSLYRSQKDRAITFKSNKRVNNEMGRNRDLP